ncbi:hypothetical protein [Flavobacterium sp. F52]|uniref:hypothetical protein n=1 Tax=Flavobacterium sp. F52 TaxID=1202532 RepID=UPI000272DFDD|nr:hypothetical protein [Flavobacterium sp. F52]EJG02293.1 hypothetical protein FF52_06420 [Flavobacterium sp. F52]
MKKITQILLAAVLLASCGARKTETEKNSIETKKDFSGFFRISGNSEEFLNTDIVLQSQYKNILTDQSKIESFEFTFEPEDNSKPAIYTDPNGQRHVVENGKLTSKKTRENKGINKEDSQKIVETKKESKAKKENHDQKASVKTNDKTGVQDAKKNTSRSAWNLLWLLIPVVIIYAIWKAFKKYKSKTPIV